MPMREYMMALPIDWNTFVSDMKEKWHYRYGNPYIRDALTGAQASYYDALTSLGVPSEVYSKIAGGYHTLRESERANIDQNLQAQLFSLIAPLLGASPDDVRRINSILYNRPLSYMPSISDTLLIGIFGDRLRSALPQPIKQIDITPSSKGIPTEGTNINKLGDSIYSNIELPIDLLK